ncbi:MAG: PKD domain-containing protein [Bacteroidia bacterium]
MRKTIYILFLLTSPSLFLSAQCPQFFNGQGVASSNPYWIGCSGGNFTIFVQPTIAITGGYTISWGDGTANTVGPNLIPPAFVSHTYLAAVDTFIVNITTSAPACSITGVVVMEITPSASIQIPLGSPVYGCTPATFNFQNSSTNISETTRFTWNFGDGTPIQAYNSTNVGQVMNHTYLPGTTNCNVAITLTAENYCNRGNPSTNVYQPIQVWDIDDVNITPDALIKCFPSTTFHFNNTTNLNCQALGNTQQRYEYWNFGDYWGLGHDSIIPWQPFSPPNRPGYDITYPGIGTYTVLLMDSSFCGVDENTITVQIIAPPTAAFSTNTDSICEGESITVTNLSTGSPNQFIWDFGDGTPPLTVGNMNPQTHTYSTAGNYTISLIANIAGASGCTSSASKQITVKPAPVAGFTLGANNFCNMGTETFVNTSTGTISSYSWNFGNGNTSVLANPPPEFYTGAGTYNVSLLITGTNGCTDNITRQVRVRQIPNSQINPFNSCVAASGSFSDASTSAPGDPIISWLWNFGDGSPTSSSQNPAHTYPDSGTYTVVLTVSTAYCNNTDSINATVHPLPISTYIQSTNAGCTPLIISFTNQSTGAATYTWSFGDGSATSSAVNPNHTFTNPQTYDTTYHINLVAVSTFGCRDTFNTSTTVYHAANAAFTSDYAINCSPLPVQFTNTSTGAVDYSWNFGDGTPVSTAANPNHLFINNTPFLQTYITTLTVNSPNGCSNSATQNILLYPSPIFTFVALPIDTGCSPLAVNFNASSGGAVYEWDFGDGSTSLMQSPSHNFINNGNADSIYHVTLITTSPFSCKDTSGTDILVHPNPVAGFTQSASLGCAPLTVSFTDQSTLANTWQWNFGDGSASTATNPGHTFTNTTASTILYNVTLQVTSNFGCIDTIIRTVEVFPQVTASFSAPANACSPYALILNNTSINAATFNWDFGDGGTSTQTNPAHTYTNPGSADVTHTITLIAQSGSGCRDTSTSTVTIFYKPFASFTPSSDSGCAPFAINFTNTSTGAINNNWAFGDGNTINGSINASHTYQNTSPIPDTNSVQLIVTTANSCGDTAIGSITVFPQVTANFISIPGGCSPLNLSLTNQSVNADSYDWDFGNGTFSTQVNPTPVYTNNTTNNSTTIISLVASSVWGCSDSIQKSADIFYKPQASFNSSSTSGCHPLAVAFTDQSAGGIHYSWDFGDASPADTTINPSHQYTNLTSAPVIYTARLIITTNDGCSDTSTQNITVYPNVIAAFSGTANGCSPLAINFTNLSTNTNSYNWDFGDGNLSTQTSPSHTYINNTSNDINYTILLTSTSLYGCTDTQTAVVNVRFKPSAGFSQNVNSGCSPLVVTFTDQSVNAITYQWNLGDGSPVEVSQNTTHTYTNATAAVIVNDIQHIVIAGNGCRDTATSSIDVNPEVTAAFTCPVIGCSPFTVSITNQSNNAATYLWDFGNGSFSAQANPVQTYVNTTNSDQTFTVQLISTSSFNCSDTTSTTITVAAQPEAQFTASPLSQLYPSAEVSVINNTTAGNWGYSWDWGDSNTSTLQNPPSNTYATWGTYNITLIVYTSNCADTLTRSVTILPPLPIAAFTIPPYMGCEPERICFVNNSQYAVSSTWEFGDGNSSNATNPCYTYFSAGTFSVKLTTTGPGGQTDVANSTVVINPKPQANFSASPTVVQIPNTPTDFLNASIDADTYFWDFGDANTSTEETPQHTYTQVAQYDVMLIATNQYGCVDTLIRPQYISGELVSDIVIPNAFTPNKTGSNGGLYDPSNFDNDVFFPFTVNGIDEYHMTIFNRWGELVFETRNLKVGWDGYYKGKLCQADVYVWKAEGTFVDGSTYLKYGDVTLLR